MISAVALSRPLTFQQFRERVWEAGGYGALAAEQRAVEPLAGR
ncbi:hypothetical protein ABZ958_18410 [Streptomyces sp. NPDC046237]